jgi:hypothetical protein
MKVTITPKGKRKDPVYKELCEKYPRFLHNLPDEPEPPVKLLPCPFCGGNAKPIFSSGIYYGAPGYFVRCTRCKSKGTPHVYGVCVVFPLENAHMILETEALEKACNSWNLRAQQNTVYYQLNNSGNIINGNNGNDSPLTAAYKK